MRRGRPVPQDDGHAHRQADRQQTAPLLRRAVQDDPDGVAVGGAQQFVQVLDVDGRVADHQRMRCVGSPAALDLISGPDGEIGAPEGDLVATAQGHAETADIGEDVPEPGEFGEAVRQFAARLPAVDVDLEMGRADDHVHLGGGRLARRAAAFRGAAQQPADLLGRQEGLGGGDAHACAVPVPEPDLAAEAAGRFAVRRGEAGADAGDGRRPVGGPRLGVGPPFRQGRGADVQSVGDTVAPRAQTGAMRGVGGGRGGELGQSEQCGNRDGLGGRETAVGVVLQVEDDRVDVCHRGPGGL